MFMVIIIRILHKNYAGRTNVSFVVDRIFYIFCQFFNDARYASYFVLPKIYFSPISTPRNNYTHYIYGSGE